jgi:MOSC domain-containing protein YiiM
MNARVAALVACTPDRRALAGDQLYVEFDLGVANLPAGSRLRIGTAVLEVTPKVHKGCAKFGERFGVDALRFVNSPTGRALRARGVNAAVVEAGRVKLGDVVTKVLPSP